ncbi:MAG TPA: chemotaxis protein CheB [Candidatus Angelobacter sp.]|nr:chemotaxis protein CheB [Candidatus Angelobacter sp.]
MKSRSSKPVLADEKTVKRGTALERVTFPVVAVGASAGGLDAFIEFFRSLPSDTGMAFVVIQHLEPSHQSLLTEIISKTTRMPVEEVKTSNKIQPNCVYVIPPNTLMAIKRGVFKLTKRSGEPGEHLSVNFFMHSLAEERREAAIGIVLSGTGTDGTLGMEEIKAQGGITLAQDPASAKYQSMPRSAIDSGCVDFIVSPQGMANELRRIVSYPSVSQPTDAQRIEASLALDQSFNKIVRVLRQFSGVDFSLYRPATIYRRAMRRMALAKLSSLRQYVAYLNQHPVEARKLYQEVLIPVTSFFRDPKAFEALKRKVYPAIVEDKSNKGTIKMWSAGCSTGEEAYSLAITLLESLGNRAASFQVQIFGTDVNEKAIQQARAAIYPENITEAVSPERLRRFFTKVEGGYRVNKMVRDMCIFVRHNLISDPPFSQMNLVSCRNVLIYMQPALHKKILPMLHYALKPSGFLLLGRAETTSTIPDLFSPVYKNHKIFSKRPSVSRLHYQLFQGTFPPRATLARKAEEPAGERALNIQAEADRVILQKYAPVGVVVNDAMEVVQFRGRLSPYLEPAPGVASLNVLKLARNGLPIELRVLINAARKKNASVIKNDVLFSSNGYRRMLNLSVIPLGNKKLSNAERYLLILFEDVTENRTMESGQLWRRGTKGPAKTEIKMLNRKLADAQEALRAAFESEEATRQEFQTANEELLSANEELQSTNEELETSKEELQAANEELNTINEELRHKNNELNEVNSDLSNFLSSTRIATVMLDRGFRIRRFTPDASKLLKITPSDVGRPALDLRLQINVPDLGTLMRQVLESLQPWEQEVRDQEGHWHSLHILPYKTLDNKIDGVVLVLQDIDVIKTASEQLRKSTEFFRGIMNTVREPLLVLNSSLNIVAVNESFLQMFGCTLEETLNNSFYQIAHGQWNIPKFRELLEQVLPKQQAVTDFEVMQEFENLGQRTMLVNANVLPQADHWDRMILLAVEDVTEHGPVKSVLQASGS